MPCVCVCVCEYVCVCARTTSKSVEGFTPFIANTVSLAITGAHSMVQLDSTNKYDILRDNLKSYFLISCHPFLKFIATLLSPTFYYHSKPRLRLETTTFSLLNITIFLKVPYFLGRMKQFAIHLFPFQYTSHKMSINSVLLSLQLLTNKSTYITFT